MNNIYLTPNEVISLGELLNRELLAVFIENLHDEADHEACARKLKDFESVRNRLHILNDNNNLARDQLEPTKIIEETNE